MEIEERRDEVDGVGVAWRRAGDAPVLYVHGVPTDGDDWLPFLERFGGVAVDLPGFGRSDKPQHFDYSIEGYERLLRGFVDVAGLDRFAVVAHDWGAVGLMLPPERIDRVVAINAVPLVPGYRWHRAARVWRTPLAGELAMGFTFRWHFRRYLPGAIADRAYDRFDHGTQRAILKLYRSAPPDRLAAAAERLGAISAPALVVWGERDPYIPSGFADAYAEALGGQARIERVEGAGHWPWLERDDVIGRVARHLR